MARNPAQVVSKTARRTTPPPGPLDHLMTELEREWELSRSREPRPDPFQLGPGIYLDVPFVQYCLIPAINQSSLALMKLSPAHFRYGARTEETPALGFGTLVHDGHLDPNLLSSHYVVVPEESLTDVVQNECRTQGRELFKAPKQSGRYKELVSQFLLQHPGKQQVSLSWMTDLAHMLKALDNHPRTSRLFERGTPEVTLVWEDADTGLLCKGRIDWLPEKFPCLVDLKSTIDNLDWCLDKWDYHIQGAFYLDGWSTLVTKQHIKLPPAIKSYHRPRPSFEFVVAEKKPPYSVRCAPADSKALVWGRNEYKFLLRKIAACRAAEHWPGPADPATWSVSRYYKPMDFPLAREEQPRDTD